MTEIRFEIIVSTYIIIYNNRLSILIYCMYSRSLELVFWSFQLVQVTDGGTLGYIYFLFLKVSIGRISTRKILGINYITKDV